MNPALTAARAVILGAAAIALAAHADRPLVSETADVIGTGDCQIEAAAARQRARGTPQTTAMDLLLSCGIGRGTQLGLDLVRSRSDGSTGQGLALGGKTNVVEPKDGHTGLALAYAVTADKPTGGGWQHGSTRLFGVATRELAHQLLGHVNLGWLRTENPRLNHATWSLGFEGEGPVRWAADVYGDDRSRPWASAGLIWPLADKLSANLAFAQQFDTPRVRQWTLGFKIEFF